VKRIAPAIAALVLLTAACSSSPKPSQNVMGVLTRSTAPRLTITPGDGSHAVRPDTRIVVRTDHGTLSQTTVTSNGHAVAGEFSIDRTSWQASWTLAPGASYRVTAMASGGGRDTTATSGFKVAAARTGLKITDVVPNRGETVGVGMPLIITFDRRVPDRDKVALEHSFEVRSTQGHEGAWVVTIKGTGRPLGWSNGWGFYQKSWDDWKKGSAVGAPTTTSTSPT
jgi:hypothetical protein